MEELKISYVLAPEIEKIIHETHRKVEIILQERNARISRKYIPSPRAREELDLSLRCEANWRKKGILKGIKIEGKFYYRVADIEQLIEDNKLD